MCRVDMKVLRFVDAKETRFQAWKRSCMDSADLQSVGIASLSGIVFSDYENVRYDQFYPTGESIC